MSPEDIIRAWKDAKFRKSLGAEERTLLPENPAGFVELSDTELDMAAGAALSDGCYTETQECTGNEILCSADGMCDSEACTIDLCAVTTYTCKTIDPCTYFGPFC